MALWQLLVKPHLDESTYVRSEPGRLDENGYQASASIWFKDKAGTLWKLQVLVNKTEQGAKTTVLGSMFLLSCLFDEKGLYSDNVAVERQLAKIRDLRPRLEALGVRKLMLNPSRCMTWDEFESSLVKIIERKKSATSGTGLGKTSNQ